MSTVSKNFAKTLGGAAAGVLSVAGLARAQAGAAAGPARRDSTVTERVIFLPGRMDTIYVIASKIVQQRQGNTAWVALTSQFDSLVKSSLNKRVVVMPNGVITAPAMWGRRSIPVAKGWIGMNAQGPAIVISDSLGVRYRFFAYQPIISVDPGSPAERAGIEPGDLLVAYNGVDLLNHEFDFSDILAPKKRVEVTVRRDNDVRNFALTVALPPEEVSRRRMDMGNATRLEFRGPDGNVTFAEGANDREGAPGSSERPVGGNGILRGARGVMPMNGGGFGSPVGLFLKPFIFSANGLFGASLSNVSDELAKALRTKKGVLVNEVPEDTPAFRAGLRAGDVIVTADNDSVTTVNGLRNVVMRRLGEQTVDLQVVRQQKVRKVTLSWR